VFLDQIVTEVGMALKLARYLLKGTHANILVGVHLQGVGNTFMMVSGRQGEMRSIENPIQAEDVSFPVKETLPKENFWL
jgi:hypothetical protein